LVGSSPAAVFYRIRNSVAINADILCGGMAILLFSPYNNKWPGRVAVPYCFYLALIIQGEAEGILIFSYSCFLIIFLINSLVRINKMKFCFYPEFSICFFYLPGFFPEIL
jgi:hypothetical protein